MAQSLTDLAPVLKDVTPGKRKNKKKWKAEVPSVGYQRLRKAIRERRNTDV